MQEILFVEDSPQSQLLVTELLTSPSVRVHCVPSAPLALRELETRGFDLILLDVGLPGGDGFDLCRQLQESPRTRDIPVIFVTGKDDVQDKVTGFRLGAEDYIVKPFDPIELRARIQARLGRIQRKKENENQIVRGSLKLLPATQKVLLSSPGGEELDLDLTPLEFRILNYLVRHEDVIVNRQELLGAVWGKNVHVVDRTTDKHISSLRHKLGAAARYIATVPGRGYRFSVDSSTPAKAS